MNGNGLVWYLWVNLGSMSSADGVRPIYDGDVIPIPKSNVFSHCEQLAGRLQGHVMYLAMEFVVSRKSAVRTSLFIGRFWPRSPPSVLTR